MTKIASSPERNTFQAKSSHKKLEEDPTDENAKAMIEMYQKWADESIAQTQDPDWQKNNMEYDLRTSEWMCAKVKASDTYAQNLYAAICNREFQKHDVVQILKDEAWSCSWRYAGGIIADMREEGDYIDWYCSGIGSGLGNGDETGAKCYVSESIVTKEIEADLNKLGWIVLPEFDETKGEQGTEMKVMLDDSAGYRGWVLERLKAQAKTFKELAEEILGEDIKNIYAVGGVVGDGEFDDTSDVELMFELAEDVDVDEGVIDALQTEIEYAETEVGFIYITVNYGPTRNKKILIA